MKTTVHRQRAVSPTGESYFCTRRRCASAGRPWTFPRGRTCIPADPPGPGRSPTSSSRTRGAPERNRCPQDTGLRLKMSWNDRQTTVIIACCWKQLRWGEVLMDDTVVSAHRTSCPSAWSPACTTGTPSCSPEIWGRPQSSATTRGSWTAAAWPACVSDGWLAAPASAEVSSDWPPPPSRSSTAAKGCLLGM